MPTDHTTLAPVSVGDESIVQIGGLPVFLGVTNTDNGLLEWHSNPATVSANDASFNIVTANNTDTPTPVDTSSPTDPELLALAQVKAADVGDRFHYDTGDGRVIEASVMSNGSGGITLDIDRPDLIVYEQAALPDVNNFTVGDEIVYLPPGGIRTVYRVDSAPKAWVETDGWAGLGGGGSVTVDAALSDSSTNPVQNQVVKAAIDAIVAGGVTFQGQTFTATAGQAAYVLAATPVDLNSLMLFVSGAGTFVRGVDYNVAGATITLVPAIAASIQAGDSVRAQYI